MTRRVQARSFSSPSITEEVAAVVDVEGLRRETEAEAEDLFEGDPELLAEPAV